MATDRYGTSGEIRWGYRCGAQLGSWWIQDGMLRAHVLSSDPVVLQHGPLVLVVPPRRLPSAVVTQLEERTGRAVPPGTELRRELLSVHLQGASLTARLRS